jgi:hypothetical protein
MRILCTFIDNITVTVADGILEPVEGKSHTKAIALKKLKKVYEGKCYNQKFIEEIISVEKTSMIRIETEHMSAPGTISVEFKAIAIVWRKGEMVFDFSPDKSIVVDSKQIKIGTTPHAYVVLQSSDGYALPDAPILPISINCINYNPMNLATITATPPTPEYPIVNVWECKDKFVLRDEAKILLDYARRPEFHSRDDQCSKFLYPFTNKKTVGKLGKFKIVDLLSDDFVKNFGVKYKVVCRLNELPYASSNVLVCENSNGLPSTLDFISDMKYYNPLSKDDQARLLNGVYSKLKVETAAVKPRGRKKKRGGGGNNNSSRNDKTKHANLVTDEEMREAVADEGDEEKLMVESTLRNFMIPSVKHETSSIGQPANLDVSDSSEDKSILVDGGSSVDIFHGKNVENGVCKESANTIFVNLISDYLQRVQTAINFTGVYDEIIKTKNKTLMTYLEICYHRKKVTHPF